MKNSELDEIRERCNRAYPGPWRSMIEGRDHQSGSSFILRESASARGADLELSGASAADQDFIAHAREDVPLLLDEVQRLRALLGIND
jgi:hypothetical protein